MLLLLLMGCGYACGEVVVRGWRSTWSYCEPWDPHRDTSDLANGCFALVVEPAVCWLAGVLPWSLQWSTSGLASGCFAVV